ncbi:cytochrome P450 89A2-like [Magnolia sinica]|uniref:cytochrome P450 89A2-like n=1 Tax=Magnolia sinica TaxID=86752 RepID=UPI00265AD0E5|nr:cytochrome P450 89A2-like [Magnolia sinica]XP_058084965.1 cytochrome P450 89A2-like [Magnolia sinica]
MEMWLLIFLSISFSIALKFLISNLFQTPNTKKKKLPPGPPTIPLFGNLLWLRKSLFDIEPVLRELRAKYGPIVTLHIGSRPAIFVADHSLAHEALIQKGSIFSDRPPATVPGRVITSNQHNISSAGYGPLWRLLRRNLLSEILHPSRVKSYAPGREWVLEILIKQLRCHADAGEPVRVVESFQYAMFCLLLLMCFGQRLDESEVKKIEDIQRRMLTSFIRFNIFAFLPKLGKFLFRKRWNWLLQMRKEQEQLLIPLIRARRDRKVDDQDEKSFVFSYVDSLLALELSEEGGRKLTEDEMVSLCSEFLNAGTDTTSTSLQWIMANLVKHQDIQSKLAEEIEAVVGKEREIIEEDLQKMPYLKAVIMEGLRRHPPGHFVLPHSVSEEVTLDGYVIPKNATINFTVAEIGLNKEIWEDPMEFRPERFLDGGEAVDITGSREIKMMPFGAGRRICPAHGLAMLHLEYFVANLVREFEWKAKDGEDVDLTEKLEFTVVMKNPLEANIISRRK